MTQSAVSNAMIRLKSELAETLFIRKGRGIELTVFAKSFEQQLLVSMQQIEHVIEAQQQFDPMTTRRIFTVYANEYAMLMLYPIVKKLIAPYGARIQFKMTPVEEQAIFDDLSRQQADVAIDLFPTIPAAFAQQELSREELVIIVRSDHPRITQQPTKAQYYSEQHAGLIMRRSNLHMVNAFSPQVVASRDIECECSSIVAMMTLCAQTDLIGVVPRGYASQQAKQFGLNIFELPIEMPAVPLKMIWHKGIANSSAHQWLRVMLQQARDQLSSSIGL